ncbi:ubiquinol-cytochrome c reductase cytochrome b subunit domain protein [Mycobacterium xenopi 4042]|uniref:Ubiquinol-cytochrome c reductase cytochrome b subunit domain protein n=1 Tax=Mycobacterium xenopi 4042 TaxID=1299334 RepID=X8DBX4_MYCXE|nr:ubiquinol-cytochrome c reductase cytochrome b subunit domain protein [Mycobacterium xenopi 4042]
MSPKLDIGRILARQADDIDTRYHPSAALRRQLNKVFPTHWSFLLGEIALYSFIVLLITGVYLTLFFDPSMTEVTYNGVYQPLRGWRCHGPTNRRSTSPSKSAAGCSSARSTTGRR